MKGVDVYTMEQLTPKQFEVLQAVKWLRMKRPEIGLSIKEVADHLGTKVETTDFHIRALIRKGKLRRTKGRNRSLEVVQ